MDARHIVAGLAVVLAVGVVPLGAALPAQAAHAAAQADGAPDDRADAADEHADRDDATETDERENATETPANETDAAERVGPPTDMPAQVPAHVERIHATIADFLQGDFNRLGPQLRDITDRGR